MNTTEETTINANEVAELVEAVGIGYAMELLDLMQVQRATADTLPSKMWRLDGDWFLFANGSACSLLESWGWHVDNHIDQKIEADGEPFIVAIPMSLDNYFYENGVNSWDQNIEDAEPGLTFPFSSESLPGCSVHIPFDEAPRLILI